MTNRSGQSAAFDTPMRGLEYTTRLVASRGGMIRSGEPWSEVPSHAPVMSSA